MNKLQKKDWTRTTSPQRALNQPRIQGHFRPVVRHPSERRTPLRAWLEDKGAFPPRWDSPLTHAPINILLFFSVSNKYSYSLDIISWVTAVE